MKKCKVCGSYMRLCSKNRYEITKEPVGLSCLVAGPVIYEAFDCPKCGCQNIVNIRESKRMQTEEKEELQGKTQINEINNAG